MKKRIKRGLLSISLSILCGFLCGKLVYNIYSDKTDLILDNNKIYLIQEGSYSSYENMRASTIGYDYAYYEDNGKYNSIIGITKNKENINKIKDMYNKDVIVTEYYLDNEKLNDKIDEYDNKLLLETDNDNIKNLISSMLNTYKEEKLNLVKVY